MTFFYSCDKETKARKRDASTIPSTRIKTFVMKYLSIISIIALFMFNACGSSDEDYRQDDFDNEAFYNEGYASEGMEEASANNFTSRKKRKKTMIHKVVHPQTGIVSSLIPMPSNWKIGNDSWEGPKGSKLGFFQGKSFQGNQYQSADQVIQQIMFPQLKQAGFQIHGVIDLPGVTQKNRENWSKFWKAMPSNDFLEAKGIELTNTQENERGLMIVNFTYSASQYGSMSNYTVTLLTTKPKNYQKDKELVLYALTNMQMTPEALAHYNQQEKAKSDQSWAAHNQRMASKRALFEAGQAAARTNSEIGDIIHNGYMNRSRIQDAGHQKTIDGIREVQPAINPYSGQEFRVQQGYKFYYMNQYGQILPSNDPFFNPENDPRYNNMNWRKVRTQ